jgi:cyclopropane-fatty-acyl-phospholipid synthase
MSAVAERLSGAVRRFSSSRALIEALLREADVRIAGGRPWDLVVHDERVFDRVLAQGSLGFGESYMDGWWDSGALDELVARALRHDLDRKLPLDLKTAYVILKARLVNLQSARRAPQVARSHYDLPTELYQRMLGRTMNYSCAYWRDAADLDAAQEAKMELIARKLGVRPGARVLDLGCGWGGLARHLASRHGCVVTGVTISRPQAEYARAACAGLAVEIRAGDYRDAGLAAGGRFDRVVSVGMFEHVGRRNFGTFLDVARRLLAPDGLLLLQTIGNCISAVDAWVDRYLFPNSILPALAEIAAAARGRFVIEDVQNLGGDYDRTLMAWHQNFEAYAASPAFVEDERFRRLWRYYLLSFAGCFRARNRNQLWQIVLSPSGMPGGYANLR